MSYKTYFDNIDAELLKISPRGDIMLLRVIAAVIPVICFALDAFYDMPVLYWLGIPFYLICLALYLEALLKTILFVHKVSAELLIVLVMTVTLIDGAPLSGAMVAWFIGFGLYISFTIIRKNREKIEALIQDSKKTAQVMRGDEIHEIPLLEVQKKDVVIVPKGAMITVDGVISEGESSIDEAFVTGEPFPVFKKIGDAVISGTLNLTAPLQVVAEKNGTEAFIAIMTREIETGLQQKSSLQKRADVTVQVLILGVTAYAFLLLFITGSLHLMATALAVVCPCAWALATPTAFAANIGRLAHSNILARGGEPLENMQDIKTLILDKTGTVTMAVPEVSQVVALAMPEQALLTLCASVESQFDHPIANTIVAYANGHGVSHLLKVTQVEDLPGRGVKARIGADEVLIGSQETLQQLAIELPPLDYNGRAIWVAVNREVKGVIVIHDIIRAEMQGLVAAIHNCGIETVLLATGDNEESEAKRVADYIGADGYFYNFKPDDKTALVKKMQLQGKVAMVGDGVNDAPALAAANVGIAIGGHKNVSLAVMSADIVILGDDAKDLITILRLSRKMGDIIKQNYTWAMGFNTIGLTLATFGVLNPIVAALFHHLSSVFVVVNASRLYFTGIENSPIGPLFKKMDEMTRRKHLSSAEQLQSTAENAVETMAEQQP